MKGMNRGIKSNHQHARTVYPQFHEETTMDYSICHFPEHNSADKPLGKLAVVEVGDQIPFKLDRVYWIYEAETGTVRGCHAHKTLRQMLICTYGSIEIKMDDGFETASVVLDNPAVGLLIEPGIWHEMVWLQEHSVLSVLASQVYNESEYIRDYDTFLQYRRANQ